jgi:hypothetical protein
MSQVTTRDIGEASLSYRIRVSAVFHGLQTTVHVDFQPMRRNHMDTGIDEDALRGALVIQFEFRQHRIRAHLISTRFNANVHAVVMMKWRLQHGSCVPRMVRYEKR